MMKLPGIFTFALLVMAAAVAGKAEENIIHGVDHFEFSYRVILPRIETPARLWLPVAISDEFQSVKIKRISTPVEYQKVADRSGSNELLIMSPTPADSDKIIEIDYGVERREKKSYYSGTDPAAFLQPDRLVSANERFKGIAENVVAGKNDALQKGRALYDHVLGCMKYDKSGTGWGRGDALYACDTHCGNCTDFHSYFIALARSVGIPARFAIGVTIPAREDQGTIGGYHCWAEFFADGKWVPVDISEAWKVPTLADYYFGHQPANRFEISRGRDLVVEAAPASGPINFLVYPLLEIHGKEVKAATEFVFHRTNK